MTARSSTSSVVALVLLTGCFAEPDLEITVKREPASPENLELTVCDDFQKQAPRCNNPQNVFPPGTSVRSVYIFIEDDLASVGLELLWLGATKCVTVVLASEPVERTLDLTATIPTWSGPGETLTDGPCM